MERKALIAALSMIAASSTLGCSQTTKLLSSLTDTPKMPAFFLGNGGDSLTIDSQFAIELSELVTLFPRPNAILCISPSWLSQGTCLNFRLRSHSFHSFPQGFRSLRRPIDSSFTFAKIVQKLLAKNNTQLPLQYQGVMDQGTWSMITHMFPNRDVPLVQMSLDALKTPAEHYHLGKQLRILRRKGVLILASGNLVNYASKVVTATRETLVNREVVKAADAQIKQYILQGDHQSLIDYQYQSEHPNLIVPRREYYLPLLYVLSQQQRQESIYIFNENSDLITKTMTSVVVGV